MRRSTSRWTARSRRDRSRSGRRADGPAISRTASLARALHDGHLPKRVFETVKGPLLEIRDHTRNVASWMREIPLKRSREAARHYLTLVLTLVRSNDVKHRAT